MSQRSLKSKATVAKKATTEPAAEPAPEEVEAVTEEDEREPLGQEDPTGAFPSLIPMLRESDFSGSSISATLKAVKKVPGVTDERTLSIVLKPKKISETRDLLHKYLAPEDQHLVGIAAGLLSGWVGEFSPTILPISTGNDFDASIDG